MKYLLLAHAALMATFCPVTLHAGDNFEVDSMTYCSRSGKITHRLLYSVPDARMEKQPVWNPVQQPIALPPEKAATAAVAWAQSHLPTGTLVIVDEIKLMPIHQDPFVGRWYYTVDLSHGQDKGKFDLYGRAVVLFDGTIVEPAK